MKTQRFGLTIMYTPKLSRNKHANLARLTNILEQVIQHCRSINPAQTDSLQKIMIKTAETSEGFDSMYVKPCYMSYFTGVFSENINKTTVQQVELLKTKSKYYVLLNQNS